MRWTSWPSRPRARRRAVRDDVQKVARGRQSGILHRSERDAEGGDFCYGLERDDPRKTGVDRTTDSLPTATHPQTRGAAAEAKIGGMSDNDDSFDVPIADDGDP